MIVSIDPGAHSGWALFDDSEMLLAAGVVGEDRPRLGPLLAGNTFRAVIEHPYVYPKGRTRDPNAIVRLAINAGMWAGYLDPFTPSGVEFVLPRKWKGNLSADYTCRRVFRCLTPAEQAIVYQSKGVTTKALDKLLKPSKSSPPSRIEFGGWDKPRLKQTKGRAHDLLDAIGIGLWAAGRLRA